MAEINEALRNEHLEKLLEPCSRALYDRALAQCAERPGGLLPSDQDVVFDLCKTQDIKAALERDLKERGVMITVLNGRQKFTKENPTVQRLSRYIELQRKLRGDLRLIPPKSAQETQEPEDDFEDF